MLQVAIDTLKKVITERVPEADTEDLASQSPVALLHTALDTYVVTPDRRRDLLPVAAILGPRCTKTLEHGNPSPLQIAASLHDLDLYRALVAGIPADRVATHMEDDLQRFREAYKEWRHMGNPEGSGKGQPIAFLARFGQEQCEAARAVAASRRGEPIYSPLLASQSSLQSPTATQWIDSPMSSFALPSVFPGSPSKQHSPA